MTTGFIEVEGGVTAARGYRAAGTSCGIKGDRPDLALLVSDRPASAAGVFTSNQIKAAPVKVTQERVAHGRAQAVVVNSGVANAGTGQRGVDDARRMAEWAGRALDLDPDLVLVASTGRIGVFLPMDKVSRGIVQAAGALSRDGAGVAEAILTTDTVRKVSTVRFSLNGRDVHVGGMAKGAGMIQPDMATMLAFLTTDAAAGPELLAAALRRSVQRSFNRISVDGCMSTNDMVILLANGAAGAPALDASASGLFQEALDHVTLTLARKIVQDGEGATKFIELTVTGALDDREADQAARAIANSPLVKTAWFGGDPNWGRLLDALGYSGARVAEELVSIWYEDVPAVRRGQAAPGPEEALAEVARRPSFRLRVDLGLGNGTAVLYTCDLSEDYVRLNKT